MCTPGNEHPPAIKLSLSNLAQLVALATEPGATPRRMALTLSDGTVVQVIADEERYAGRALPALDASAAGCLRALQKLRADRLRAAHEREAAEQERDSRELHSRRAPPSNEM